MESSLSILQNLAQVLKLPNVLITHSGLSQLLGADPTLMKRQISYVQKFYNFNLCVQFLNILNV